jgi:uncharacterized zinc-type alcohol dehydrogenase-like protein
MKKLAGRFDLVVNTASAPHDIDRLLGTLAVDGAMVLVGVPPEAAKVSAGSLIGGRRSLGGSLIGGIAETQEVLDHCAKHRIGADVEVIPIRKIDEAYERMVKGDVRYRFVIDLSTL